MPPSEKSSHTRLKNLFKNHFYKVSFLITFLCLVFFYSGKNLYELILENLPEKNFFYQPFFINISPAPYPEIKGAVSPPLLTAKSAVLMDVPSSVVLFKKEPYLLLNPASTTKIMTALIALESYNLNEIITVGYVEKTGAQMGLETGDQISVENLLYGLLVNSGNDAAVALALHYPGGMGKFVDKMNEKAQNINLYHTFYKNPTGLYTEGHYTTSLDLARLGAYAMKNPLFAKIVATKKITVTDISGNKNYHLENVNKLLGMMPGINGIKTGWTEEAGECLVASVKREDRELISVILGSENRFADTLNLLQWGFKYATWEK